MTETSQLPEETGKSEPEAVKTSEKVQKKIAKIVRENSQNLGKKLAVASALRGGERARHTVSALISVSSLSALFPDLKPEGLEANLNGMLKEEAPEPEKVETEPAKDEAAEVEPEVAAAEAVETEPVKAETAEVEPARVEAKPPKKIKENKFKDIKAVVVTATDARYLYSEMYIAGDYAEFLARAEETQILVAEKVRETSEKLGELTTVSSLDSLVPALEPGELDAHIAGMVEDERFKDIKSLVAVDGTRYLYSDTHITKERAEAIARVEAIKAGIAVRVRKTSWHAAKLTSIDSLMAPVPAPEPEKVEDEAAETEAVEAVETETEKAETEPAEAVEVEPVEIDALSRLVPPLELGEVETCLAEMAEDERYPDIKSLVASTGAVYLYSELHMASTWAGMALRAEVGDPFATIAETVRDESRLYPRSTDLKLFNEPVFGLNPAELEKYFTGLMEQEEYKDIKIVHASNGAAYLYSSLHMRENEALAYAEFVEVEEPANP